MAISPLNAPVNVKICSTNGTIFSSGSGSGGGSGQTYNFSNTGSGARVLNSLIGNNVPFRSLVQGNNIVLTEEQNDIKFDINDLAFDSTAPSTSPIIGLNGVTLGKTGILQTLQALLYPIRPPILSLSLSPSQFEFGDTENIIVSWGVTRTDEPIIAITVNSQSQGITGNTQSGTLAVSNTGQSSITVPMSAASTTKNASTNATTIALRKVRYGFSTKDGLVSVLTDADLNALTGSFYSTGIMGPFQFTVPTNNYLVICIPTAFGSNWAFLINGFNNNAFSKVRNNAAFVNSFGFSDNVNVWVSKSFATGPILLAPYQTN